MSETLASESDATAGRAMKHKGLGRGLGLLIRDNTDATDTTRRLLMVSPHNVQPNAAQPRKHFGEQEMEALTETVRERGVLQPLLVRRTTDGYQIVAGERRWRAARAAGLEEIPVYVTDTDDEHSFELSMIENLQRQNLDPIEEAEGYARMADLLGYTHDEMASRVGKDRATISNSVRLLKLSEPVRDLLKGGALTPGHGRALLVLPTAAQQRGMARAAVAKGMSVRELERRAKAAVAAPGAPVAEASTLSPDMRAVEMRLQTALGSHVRIRPAKRGTR